MQNKNFAFSRERDYSGGCEGPSGTQPLEEGKIGQGTRGEGLTKAERAGLTMGRKHRNERGWCRDLDDDL